MKSTALKSPPAEFVNTSIEFRDLVQHFGKDVKKVEDPEAEALLRTAAEVIAGVDLAFQHYKRIVGRSETRNGSALRP